MKASVWVRRIFVVLLATLMIALSATMAWATAYEYSARANVSRGVSVNGHDLSGLSETAARGTIEEAVATPLQRPITVMVDGERFTFDPKNAVEIDMDEMLAQAYSPRKSAPILSRVRHDFLGDELAHEVQPAFTVDEAVAAAWVRDVAAEFDRPAVDAVLSVVGTQVEIDPEETGREIDVEAALAALREAFESGAAFSAGERVVTVPVRQLEASVKADSFGQTIVVKLSERRVWLYDGEDLVRTYRCAVGKPGFSTPSGVFEITAKRYLPTWGNPGSAWAKDMPASIPPGPGNPLGTRALNLSVSGIRFHGTSDVASIGTAASHGCMRMVRSDIEDLYDRVDVGTAVHILR